MKARTTIACRIPVASSEASEGDEK